MRKSNLVSHKERCINKLSDEVGDVHPKPAVIREERNESQLIVKDLKDESGDYKLTCQLIRLTECKRIRRISSQSKSNFQSIAKTNKP